MSEIILAISLWVTVVLQARDTYFSKSKAFLGIVIAFATGYSVFAYLQLGKSGFTEPRSFPLYMAVWMPLFTWAYSTRVHAVVLQHGEASLHRKYGAPKLNLDLLEDQRLARMVKLSQICIWSFVAVFIVERIFTYMQIAT